MKTGGGNRGFIGMIVTVVIAVLVLSFFGINPKEIWLDYALPALQFVWNAFISILGYVIELAIQLADKLGIGGE